MSKKKLRVLVTLDPEVRVAIFALAKAAGVPVSQLLRSWIQDSLPVLHSLTSATIAARQGRPESAIKILDGMVAQQVEQIDFISEGMKEKVRRGKKKAR